MRKNNLVNNTKDYSDKRVRKLIYASVFFIVIVVVMSIISMPSREERQNIELRNAIQESVRENNDNNKLTVNDLKRSGEYAVSRVDSGNISVQTFYKINPDKTFVELITVQNPDYITILLTGIPIQDLSNLLDIDLTEIQSNIINQCGYNEDSPGYTSWREITTNGNLSLSKEASEKIEDKLNNILIPQNKSLKNESDKIVCVAYVQNDNSQIVNPYVNVTTSFQIYYIMANGQLELHNIKYVVDMKLSTVIMLDGNEI